MEVERREWPAEVVAVERDRPRGLGDNLGRQLPSAVLAALHCHLQKLWGHVKRIVQPLADHHIAVFAKLVEYATVFLGGVLEPVAHAAF